MANAVTAVALGGTPQILNGVATVADAKSKLGLTGNYAASVNGDPAADDDQLEDYCHVSFAPASKGGM